MCYARSMGKKKHFLKNCIVTFSLVAVLAADFSGSLHKVYATDISQVQSQIESDKNVLSGINDKISGLTQEQDILEEEIADLDAEVVNLLTSIGLKEDEIAAKKVEINGKENEIAVKQVEIGLAEQDYEAAKEQEDAQYQAMVRNIRVMYENNGSSLLTMLLESESIGDFLNLAEYTEKVYDYDQQVLADYKAAKEAVAALWDKLEADKKQLEADEAQLNADREQLEADREQLNGLKEELDRQLAQKKAESADYDAEIRKYKNQASEQKKKIQKEEKELKRLQEEERKKQEAANKKATSGANPNATGGNYSDTGYVSTIDSAAGSDLGKKIAKYACQFIGNPYVSGGTSLTNGADCSGFTYRVYKDFGYSLPRTSYEQRSVGKEVSYAEAQPGDLICYSGHVAMYIGNGLIVHASTKRTGIKISNANYRSWITIRRVI